MLITWRYICNMEIEWIDMVHYQQQVQKISRMLLPSKRGKLTSSECELLAWLYLKPECNTPLLLSQLSKMKKEAVSRCLKSLYEKGCITREKKPDDERSYQLMITSTGLSELKEGYQAILHPFYQLLRECGTDFEEFLKYTDRIVNKINERDFITDDEVL